jgi:hypothetical protein
MKGAALAALYSIALAIFPLLKNLGEENERFDRSHSTFNLVVICQGLFVK